MRQGCPSLAGVAVAWLLLGSSQSLAQPAAPPSPGAAQPIAGTAPQTADQRAQLAALVNEIAALDQELSQLLKQLSQHRSARPTPPPAGASDEARMKYAQALQAWEAQRAALQKKLDQLRARASQLEQRLDQLESQVSSAQREDVKTQRSALEAIKQQLAQASAKPTGPAKPPMRKPGSLAPAPGATAP